MRIAVIQSDFIVGDVFGNKNKIIEQINNLNNSDADLIILPEMAISGTPTYDIVNMPDFVDKCFFALSDIAECAGDTPVLIGTPSVVGDDIFNSVVLLRNGEIDSVFNKAMIFSRDEQPYYSGIDSPYFSQDEDSEDMPSNIVEVGRDKLMVVIGEDIDFMDMNLLKTNRPSLIVNIASNRYSHNVISEDYARVSSVAKDSKIPLLYVNATGASTDIIYYGASALFNAKGECVNALPAFKESSTIINFNPERIKDMPLVSKNPSHTPKMECVYEALRLGIGGYFSKNGFKTACLGLSGGIDSAVVAVMLVDTLGGENVKGLLLPSQFSSDHSISDSVRLADNLGMDHHTIGIEKTYSTIIESLSGLFGDLPFSVAEENLQSRIRAVLLMAYSNKFGHLLLNTTNKSEAAMGYGTLYGDSCGALSIIADLYKSEVYELARYINRDREIIPENIINKAPSAELRPEQKDSDSLPEYSLLDGVLYDMIEGCASERDIIASGVDEAVVEKVSKALHATEHKRYQGAPVLRMSKCVLGKDRVIPLVSKNI